MAWGDVVVDEAAPLSVVHIHLKQSKCDQLRYSVDMFIGRIGASVCPVEEVLYYVM